MFYGIPLAVAIPLWEAPACPHVFYNCLIDHVVRGTPKVFQHQTELAYGEYEIIKCSSVFVARMPRYLFRNLSDLKKTTKLLKSLVDLIVFFLLKFVFKEVWNVECYGADTNFLMLLYSIFSRFLYY